MPSADATAGNLPEPGQSGETALHPAGGGADNDQVVGSFALPNAPNLPHCPLCDTGLLYTIAYDPEALHENQVKGPEGDPRAHGHFVPSGGSITLRCFRCGRDQTHALNPGGGS